MLDQMGSAAQYIHILENVGSKTITSIIVVYEITDATHTHQEIIARTARQKFEFKPGTVKFMAAPPDLALLAGALNFRQISQDLGSKALFLALERLTGTSLPKVAVISVDHVGYADGTGEGPGGTQMVNPWAEIDQRLSVFFQEMLSRASGPVSDADLIAWLQSFQHQPGVAGQPPDIAGLMVEEKAQAAISLLGKQDRSGLIPWAQRGGAGIAGRLLPGREPKQ